MRLCLRHNFMVGESENRLSSNEWNCRDVKEVQHLTCHDPWRNFWRRQNRKISVIKQNEISMGMNWKLFTAMSVISWNGEMSHQIEREKEMRRKHCGKLSNETENVSRKRLNFGSCFSYRFYDVKYELVLRKLMAKSLRKNENESNLWECKTISERRWNCNLMLN